MPKDPGIRLYHLRTAKLEVTQEKLAGMLGITRTTYTKYENGDHFPSYEVLKKLKAIFETSYDDLIDPKLDETEIADDKMRRWRKQQDDEENDKK